MRFSSSNFQAVSGGPAHEGASRPCVPPPKPDDRGHGTPNGGFSLVEILVVSTLLALIVFALMSVFSSTQRAFRASVTQTGVLEGGRAATDLIVSDISRATPSYGHSSLGNPLAANGYAFLGYGVNFFVSNNSAFYQPLVQTLPGSSVSRTNELQWFFVLSRQNTEWIGVGYIVNTASTNYFYPLYRYYAVTNTTSDPAILFNYFLNDVSANYTNMSHVLDGVVHMVVRAYDPSGLWITNGYVGTSNTVQNTYFTPLVPGVESSFVMTSNALPASVEVQLGVMEDRAVARCEAMNPGPVFDVNGNPLSTAQWNYMQGLAGRVHVFRQRATIENVDPTIYQ